MKKDTIKLSTGACRLVAHRGLSGLETENTCAAFLAAGLRRVWGIETDVHPTADGRFVCCHDADLRRVSGGTSLDVRKSPLAEAQAVPLLDPDGATRRSDLRVPLFEDYLAICRKYDRVPVVELKDGPFDLRTVRRIASLVREAGLLDRAVFIAFDWGDCLRARRACPDNEVMHLVGGGGPVRPLAEHARHRIGADYHHPRVSPELVAAFHAAGLRVNAWIVDDPADAARMLAAGVDFLTTDILEEA
jgi:glycerophosphoryl diester phosphodiesterase